MILYWINNRTNISIKKKKKKVITQGTNQEALLMQRSLQTPHLFTWNKLGLKKRSDKTPRVRQLEAEQKATKLQ
jgi:hypothetical protein